MRKTLGLLAKIAISLALLYFALGRVNLTGIGERLAQIRPGWMLAAVAAVLVQTVLLGLRWRIIVRRSGTDLAPGRAIRFTLIAAFFNQTLPSTIGGDAARIWLIAGEGAGWAKAAYSVLVDRAIGLLVLAAIVLVTMPLSFQIITDPAGRAALLAVGLGCVGAAVAFIALGTRRFAVLDRWAPTRHIANAAAVAHTTIVSPTSGVSVAGLSLAIHVTTFLTAWLVAQSVAAPLSFLNAVLLVPPVLLVASVPLSIAGWGVRESAMVLAFSYGGLAASDGLLVSLLLGAALFVVGVAGGLVWLFSPDARRPSLTGPREPVADAQMR